MCQIIIANRKLTIRELKENWECNKDGAGFVYKGKVYKGLMKLVDLLRVYLNVVEKDTRERHVLHFRTATSGKVSEENTHPFIFSGHYALFHNGTISFLGDEEKSDTRMLAELVLNSKNFKKILQVITQNSINKFTVVDLKTNKIWTFGNFYEKNGLLYSSYPYKYSYLDYSRYDYLNKRRLGFV